MQPTHGTLLKYLSIPVNDDEREDLVAWFPKAFEFIDEGIQKGGVLVHCAAGAFVLASRIKRELSVVA